VCQDRFACVCIFEEGEKYVCTYRLMCVYIYQRQTVDEEFEIHLTMSFGFVFEREKCMCVYI